MSKGFATLTVHGAGKKNLCGALIPPIFQTSTFGFENAGQGARRFAGEEDGFIYSRLGNPTVNLLEEKIALLEKGEACAAFSSGMGAISAVFHTLTKSGYHVVADTTLYGCTFSFLNDQVEEKGVKVDFVDCSDLKALKKVLRADTKILYFETPANPNLKIVDIRKVSQLAHSVNEGCFVVVDNTFATPYLTNPLELGADIVVHSVTKYINGHGDVVAGAVVSSEEIISRIKSKGRKDSTGAVMSPFDAFLVLRGIKTLKLRMDAICQNAMKVANFLQKHPMVERVYFPGLKSHPGHRIAKRQMRQFGGIISFEVKGGVEVSEKVLDGVKLCIVAVSLGDTETLIQHPASMTHKTYSEKERKKAGITDGLIRLSIGIEDADDIIEDLKEALDALDSEL